MAGRDTLIKRIREQADNAVEALEIIANAPSNATISAEKIGAAEGTATASIREAARLAQQVIREEHPSTIKPLTGGNMALLVGERGLELILPSTGGSVIPPLIS